MRGRNAREARQEGASLPAHAQAAPPLPLSPASGGEGPHEQAADSSAIIFYFSTFLTDVSGLSPPRWRASVSLPVSSHSPRTARAAHTSQRSIQSPSV